MKRSKNAFLQEKQNSFTEFLKGTGGWLLVGAVLTVVVMILIACRPSYAATDWHDNDVSEQIQQSAREQARKLWREENGDWQPNLTAQAEKQARTYTELKQSELNNGNR